MPLRLQPHPSSPDLGVQALEVSLRPDGRHLLLNWCLHADMERLLLPPPAEPRRADRLWEHCCFELFAANAEGPGYREFNVSPGGAWAVYDFSDYRQPVAGELPDPEIRLQPDYRPLQWRLEWQMPLAMLPPDTARLGLSAVLEGVDGQLAYWALAHPARKPDFHDPRAFTVDWAR